MAGDVVRAGTVVVPSRRVGRALRRLLVLGGLLIGGWLLGCAAQSAHADELPAAPSRVVAEAPVLEHAVEAATERPPVPQVVRTVVDRPPVDVEQATPPIPEVSEGVTEAPGESDAAGGDSGSPVRRWVRPAEVVEAGGVGGPGRSEAARQVTHRVVHDLPAPAQVPEAPADHSVVGGAVMSGVTAGAPNVVAWVSAPPRASQLRVAGAVPPAVRTAADEPSFAPD